jgi:uncharacterized RDD family membrane protein YckC
VWRASRDALDGTVRSWSDDGSQERIVQQEPAYNPYTPPSEPIGAANPYADPFMQEDILAGRGTRLAAHIVDGILYGVTAIPGAVLAFMSMEQSQEASMELMAMLIYLGPLLLFAYNAHLISKQGQTIAKRWLGIRIIKTDGSPCGFVHGVLLRSIAIGCAGLIPAVGPIVSLVDPLLIFGEERRCLHDLIAGTKVVVAEDGY